MNRYQRELSRIPLPEETRQALLRLSLPRRRWPAAALIAADDVVIPIELDAFSIDGMGNIIQQVDNMRRLNNRLRVAGVLPTKWYKDDTIMDAESILRQSSLNVFPRIRYSKRMKAVTFSRELSGKKTAPMRDYRLFVGQYVKQGGCGNG